MPVRYDNHIGGGQPGQDYSYQPPADNNYYYNTGTASVGRRATTLGRAPTRRIVPGANSIANAPQNIQRGRTLIRPDRYQEPPPLMTGKPTTQRSLFDPWVLLSRIVTFWALPPMLKAMKMPDKGMQQAWREKITLCFIIACMGGFVAFITIGLSSVLCPPDQALNQQNYASYDDPINSASLLGVLGWQFNITESKPTDNVNFYQLAQTPGTDITNYFQHGTNIPACQSLAGSPAAAFQAVTFDPCSANNGHNGCSLGPLSLATFDQVGIKNTSRQVGFDWAQLALPKLQNYFVIDGNVLNMDPYIAAHPQPIQGDDLDGVIRTILNQTFAEGGRDGTKLMFRRSELQSSINCLVQKYKAGHIDKSTPGCFTASIVLVCSLFVVLSIVLARFFMALIFSWFISRKLSRTPPDTGGMRAPTHVLPNQTMEMSDIRSGAAAKTNPSTFGGSFSVDVGNDLYTVMLITCYSENTEGIQATVESLSMTDYPDDRKLLFLIADGIITGHGETISTPDMCLGLVTFDNPEMKNPEPKSYIAVANGAKQHNCAKVYAGHYVCKGHKVPMILVVKCGNPDEQGKPKAGNRGKRDSQLILMNFFSRVTYNDRMTPLDYELFQKITYLMKVTPDHFELVLMVDADTKVYQSSLRLLVNCMVNDNLIMGLCGETKIANKRDSWVTAIQVYEYFISHHLAKGFEAVFGGVTCLPGCFCMYRLKARKGDGDWIPIITKPEIVQEYSSNTIDTLHQKNLLLLGEDRFLTTLMLRNFPFRKMVFTPQAICKTVVPDEFKVLLSQRRRWINSTIHNLFELVLVRNLCGTFCFSMQFVVMMDLVGTLTLPVAIVLTVVLIVSMAQTQITSLTMAVPLILLIIVLFSPAFLILITTRKWVYLMWMFVYLLALPIWNFVLPVYSFWHFDDFSWGETRKVEGEQKGDDHSKGDGQFDPSKVPLKRWEDYERKRVRANKRRERKERQLREMGPVHLTHSVVAPGEDESKRGLLADPGIDDDSGSNISFGGASDISQANPMHYFDPSREAPAKSGSGYYPAYRPQSQAPARNNPPLQPHPTASGPWGSHQGSFASSPGTPPTGPGQYVGSRPAPPSNQNSFHGF
ncbi:chitin synthase-domain-containing protein [Radiomyces spectabilis]|uniref:chitin synthase-domain-containing protein n=1 Tax=Radiomyces spectabilis TaxID=64574 RepID=UPI00221FEE9E|nr:chitin synthase-domain-containing protein [Radiomyces spectabilis]KAI8374422.1 chitin synthase-domain-containing protein [Radiomyces spectabilis]